MKALLAAARSATPYLLIEVILPGGTMIALLMWAVRNKSALRTKGIALGAQAGRLMGRITGVAASASP